MSDNNKRLGVNPLSWVDADTPAENPIPIRSGETAAPITAATETAVPKGDLFKLPATITQEELMGKNKVKIKQTIDTAQAVAHLEDLASSLASGLIRAENGDDSVVLCAGDSMKFEMKLSRKKDKAKCSIEMEWEDDGSKVEGFKISG